MNKKNLILAAILFLLVLVSYVYQGPMQDWKAKSGKQENFLQAVNIDEINSIEIVKNGELLKFNKQDNRWKIDGTKDFYIKDDIMVGVISSLKEAQKAEIELVSENPEKKGDFQVDDQGNRIRLMKDSSILVEFVVGKVTTDYKGSFISMPDFPKTYALEKSLGSLDREDWYDKTIFKTEKEKINKIRFQYPTREFTVEKKENKWMGTLPNKFSVKDEKIDEILDVMSNLNAAEISAQIFEGTGLEKHSIIIEVGGEEASYSIMIGDEAGDELYFAKKGDSDNIYLITKEQRNKLDKQAWELK